MRILMLHSDEFSYHVTDKTGAVGKGHELAEDLQQGKTGEALVVFCCSILWMIPIANWFISLHSIISNFASR